MVGSYHGFLIRTEGTIIRANAEEVATSKHVHEVVLGGGVRTEGRTHDVSSCVAPVLVPHVGAVSSESRSNGLPEHSVSLLSMCQFHK